MTQLVLQVPESVFASLHQAPDEFWPRVARGGSGEVVRTGKSLPRQGCRNRRAVPIGLYHGAIALLRYPFQYTEAELIDELRDAD